MTAGGGQQPQAAARVKFAGIMGMIYDEFAMKRIGGLFRRVHRGECRRGPAGLTPAEVFEACRAELRSQQALVTRLVEDQLRPALRDLGTPILDAGDLTGQGGQILARVQDEGLDPSIACPLGELGACRFRRPAWG